MSGARWFVRGDLDGFFGLALDNLIQLLLIVTLCTNVLGFPPELLYGQVLPAAALSLLAGNVYYSWLAVRIARAEGRDDVCALPYGINTLSLIAYVFLVMLPVKLATGDPHKAWQAGVIACLGSGVIELAGAWGLDWMRRWVPRAALLSTLAGIAVTFIAFDFLFRTYAAPLVGLSTFVVVCLVYFGGLRFRGGIPGGLIAVALGTALCWLTGLAPVTGPEPPTTHLGLQVPLPVFGDLGAGLAYLMPYLSVIIPMGLFSVFGSIQNLESAAAAGDRYPTRGPLAVNGAGTIVAALFGSCFPTTIYIGHPGWKALGARAGYSWLNGAFMTVVCVSGAFGLVAWAVPIEAGMAIVLWIAIVISAQAFQATPRHHAPAVVIGLLPGIVAFGALMLKQGVRAGLWMWTGVEGGITAAGPPAALQSFGPELAASFEKNLDLHATGAFAGEQGIIFTAMLLAGATVAIIERRFRLAALWLGVAAGLSAVGLMHGWQWTGSDAALSLDLVAAWTWPFSLGVQAAFGYALGALICLAAPYLGTTAPAAPDATGAAESPTPPAP